VPLRSLHICSAIRLIFKKKICYFRCNLYFLYDYMKWAEKSILFSSNATVYLQKKILYQIERMSTPKFNKYLWLFPFKLSRLQSLFTLFFVVSRQSNENTIISCTAQ
jgi:hypothetical protein